MNNLQKFLLLQILFFLSILAQNTQEFHETILELTDQNFEEQLNINDKENKVVLAMFYAPWCGHCKRLKTIWNDLANEIKEKQYTNLTLIAINCDQEKQTSSRMRVYGYPTVFAFHQGKNYKFKGKRTKEILLNFAFYEFKNEESKNLQKPPSTTEIIKESFQEIIGMFKDLIKAHPFITIGLSLVIISVIVILIVLILSDIHEAKDYEKLLQEKRIQRKAELLEKLKKKED